jgi:hypothetical protein
MRVPESVVPAGRWHAPLLILSVTMAALSVFSLVAMLFDDRVLLGAPVWMKVVKFGVSVTVYSLTMAWLLAMQTRGRRCGWWLGTVVAVTLGIEMFFVTLQAAMAQPSHFGLRNVWQKDVVAPWMGTTIMVFLVAIMALALLLAFQPLADQATRTAVRAGLGISLLGMLSGFLMFSNVSRSQVDRMKAGEPTLLGAHSVGVSDGGKGLPVTYWSTAGGDLRVPHFVGLHALQVLPLLALGLLLLASRSALLSDERTRVALVRVLGLGYLGLFGLVLWQAQRGQPLVHPDMLTLAALGGLIVLTGAGGTAVLLVSRRRIRLDRPLSDRLPNPLETPMAS